MLRNVSPSALLRSALLADAAASGGMGLLLVLGARPAAPFLALPEALLFWAGAALLPFAALVAWAGTRSRPPLGTARAIAFVNYAWVLASLILLVVLPAGPSPIGSGFVLAQALAVLLLAAAQTAALRRLRQASMAGPVEFGWRRSS
jgi:hypothetical protein